MLPESKQKLLELHELLEVPAVQAFFLDQLDTVKRKFEEDICEFKRSVDGTPSFRDGFSVDKSYFFELNRCNDPDSETGYKWELKQFKLKAKPETTEMIFSGFIKRLDRYETAPGLIQKKTVKSGEMNKAYEINFMKSAERVVGFVRVIELDPEDMLKKNSSRMIRVATNYQNVDKEEMYRRIINVMKEDPEVRDDIFFYFHMLQKTME